MRRLLLILVLTACSAEKVGAPRLAPSSRSDDNTKAPVHSVTGSGTVVVGPGFSFASSIAVHQDATGRVWGEIVTHIIDLSAFNVQGRAEVQQEAECMRVVGNTAYIGLVVTNSSNNAVAAVGDRGVLWVQDNGSGNPDIHYGGPAAFFDPNHLICSDTPPALPPTVVSNGNFTVR